MNVSFLLEHYFKGTGNVSIDVFDSVSLNSVYRNVMDILTAHFDIELGVLQAVSYCFYEILDNVHIHSGKPLGTALTHYDKNAKILQVLVADDGQGVCNSLKQNPKYADISEAQALSACVKDSVTDGKGMGFGLYATGRLVKDAGIRFVIHSGHHKLVMEDNKMSVKENGFWQGTIVYMEIRTDAAGEFNEQFVDDESLTGLWHFAASGAFIFAEYGTDFGTREDGARLRTKILESVEKYGTVSLDFTGVGVVSNSFADECIAKLLLEMPLEKLRKTVSFCGLNYVAQASVLVALQRRYRFGVE